MCQLNPQFRDTSLSLLIFLPLVNQSHPTKQIPIIPSTWELGRAGRNHLMFKGIWGSKIEQLWPFYFYSFDYADSIYDVSWGKNIKNMQTWFLRLRSTFNMDLPSFRFCSCFFRTNHVCDGLRIVAGAGNFNSSLEGKFKLPNVQWTAPCTILVHFSTCLRWGKLGPTTKNWFLPLKWAHSTKNMVCVKADAWLKVSMEYCTLNDRAHACKFTQVFV